MKTSKYTVSGGEKIDATIEAHMKTLVSETLNVAGADTLSAIVLGGGYGRGEGGVKIRDGEQCLFNDYDVFLISNGINGGMKKAFNARFRDLATRLSAQFGIEVDFSPLKNSSELRSLEYEMVWFEAKQGHIVLWGDPSVFDAIPEWNVKDMPLPEAARLLMNRGMGILLSKRRLASGDTSEEAMEFVERNAWKATMAAGDSFLILRGIYDSSYVKRKENFKAFSSDEELTRCGLFEYYLKSIEYKLSPPEHPLGRTEAEALLVKSSDFLLKAYLPIASRISGHETSFREMAETPPDLSLSHGLKSILKNVVLNTMKFGASYSNGSIFKHPRSRIFAAIPHFLGAKGADERQACLLLGIEPGSSHPDAKFERLKKLWERFS